MKRYILFGTVFFITFLQLHADPLLVAVLMVKDEAPVMELTLQPLIDAGIKDFLIYDTGSTDDTIQITQDYFVKNNISNFVIEQGQWVDFATGRNQALKLTEQHFPDATFMLMLDAEWILHNGVGLIAYCKQQKNNPETLYYIKVTGVDIDLNHARLIRCKSNISFVGKVHEVPNIAAQAQIPSHIYFQLSPTYYGEEKSQARLLWDLDALLQEFQENPDNPRTVYYLANTYFCLQDWDKAIKWYEYRTTMYGWDEENFLAYYCLAHAYAMVENAEKMINNYLKAFALRPHRAEPLIRLAGYYYSIKAYHLSYVFSKYAVSMPYPHQDVLQIEKYLYDFVRYNLISVTAALFGDFNLGKQATLQALKVHPNIEYLHKNLEIYETLLQEKK